jgi:glucose-6-phosphate isomerase
MESLGKSVTREGEPVGCATGPVVWGEPGSNAQHSFFQLLHQGSGGVSLDILLPATQAGGFAQQQALAIANALAQAQAFMEGYDEAAARVELGARGLPPAQVDALAPHKVHPGSRPATLILFRQLDPRTLGMLVALYEHKVYVQAAIWDLNPFDQWGVELGKKLAAGVLPAVRDGALINQAPAELRPVLEWIRRNQG